MTHEQIREMLSAGETSPEVDGHLEGCTACRAWNESLQRVRAVAPSMFAEAPPALPERVLTAVKASAPAAMLPLDADEVVPIRFWRRVGTRAAMAAGIAATVAAAAVLVPRSETPAVAVAAKNTGSQRTARVEFTSSFSLRPPSPIELPTPDLGALRDGFRRGLPPELAARIRASVDALPKIQRPKPIERISSTIRGEGEVAFPDRMRFSGRVTESNTLGPDGGAYETIVVKGRTWTKMPLFGSRWVELPAFGLDINVDFHPGSLILGLEGFRGAESDRGEETIDGERVRHYRVTSEKDFGPFLGRRTTEIDVWVGVDDSIVRRIRERHTSDGDGGRLRAETVIRFHDFGVDVSIDPPRDATTLDEAVAGFIGLGFGMAGSALGFSFDAAARMPEFSFPEIDFDFPDFSFSLPEFELPAIHFPGFELPDFRFPTPSFSGSFDFSFGSPSPSPSSSE